MGPSGDNKKSKMQAKLRRQFIIALNLSLLFGLGWGVGFAATTSIGNVGVVATLQAIFILLTSFQGIFIFIMQCARSEDARKEWARWVQVLTRNQISWDEKSKKFKRGSDRTTSVELTKRSKGPAIGNIYSSVSSSSGASKKALSKNLEESSFAKESILSPSAISEVSKTDLSQEKKDLSITAKEEEKDILEEKRDLSLDTEESKKEVHNTDDDSATHEEVKVQDDMTHLIPTSPVFKITDAKPSVKGKDLDLDICNPLTEFEQNSVINALDAIFENPTLLESGPGVNSFEKPAESECADFLEKPF